ncbi:dihydrofolate reductase [Microbacter margulisiae]|uniref:Dihydrofolate reductase n=1 Tax=Microbacter margulisiae TaxID=1350067 RepID=A0A7W5DPB1_9PORP|nr:dihydrofolate reductase [Microbacter margulisiae]MBB3186451.1 dihydrofolate reductase [Microbacter margulisiae]
MPIISIIAAIAENHAIGYKNQLLCHIPDDLKRFKRLTLNHPIIMGRNTFLSLPKGALPERKNIVVTHQLLEFEGCATVHSIEDAVEICKNEEEIFIIGGSSLYSQIVPKADKMYLTHIYATFQADAFFPTIVDDEWKKVFSEYHPATDKIPFGYSFVNYEHIHV